jgi:N-acetylmuramoyl-L-alanine amidase
MRAPRWTALHLLFLVGGLAGCAGNRAALAPVDAPGHHPVSASPARPPAPVPAAPVTAKTLASRNGLGYQDAGSFVLLSDRQNFVRLYPGSNRISVDGQPMVLRGKIVRDGRTILVPGPAAALIESSLRRERSHILTIRAESGRMREPALDPITPLRVPAKMPSAAKTPSSSSVRGDAAWSQISGSERSWKWIVLHHSDDTSGCAAKYNADHLAKGWENGLGYHFVIGNGTQSGDGEVEIGSRWTSQIQGAHAKTPDNCYNEQGIGICLVGDFEHGTGRPTRAQMDALARLCRWLMERYSISSDRVMGHADCKPTACPGRNFPWADLRRRLNGA